MKYEIGISGAVIVSAQNRYRPFIGSVGVSGDRIAAVWKRKLKRKTRVCLDADGKILMPGLVNRAREDAHDTGARAGDDMTLLEQNHKFADTGWFIP